MKAFPFSPIILEERKTLFVLLLQETHLKMNVLSVGYKAVVCQRWKLWHRVTFNSVNVSRIQDESVPGSLIFGRGFCGPMHRVASSSLPHLLYSSFLWRARVFLSPEGLKGSSPRIWEQRRHCLGLSWGVWGERRRGRLLEPGASDVTPTVTF